MKMHYKNPFLNDEENDEDEPEIKENPAQPDVQSSVFL